MSHALVLALTLGGSVAAQPVKPLTLQVRVFHGSQEVTVDTRVTVLGHVQRGGTPSAFDRVLATRFGIAAIDAVHDGAFGQMVALQAGKIVRLPLSEAVAQLKTVDPELLEIADVFSG